jgi:hypothetical protein
MRMPSQFRTSDRERDICEGLVATLRQAVHTLSASIEVEEERTQLRDEANPHYSLLAKSMRGRASNLRETIVTLEARSVAA